MTTTTTTRTATLLAAIGLATFGLAPVALAAPTTPADPLSACAGPPTGQ